MVVIYIIAAIYATIGFVYALYILLSGIDPWYTFPLNFILGPITLMYNYYTFAVKKGLPR